MTTPYRAGPLLPLGEVRPTGAAAPTQLAVAVLAAAVGTAMVAQPLIGALVVCALLAMVVSLRPEWLTLAVIALLYSNAVVVAGRVHGMPEPLQGAFLLLLAVPVAHHLLIERRPLVLTPATPWLVAFLLVQAISAVLAADPGSSLERVLVFLLEGFVLYLAVINAVRRPAVVRQIVWLLLVVGGLLGTLSLLQALTGTHENDYFGFAQVSEESLELRRADPAEERGPPRAGGPVAEKNRYAQILVVLVPLGLLRATTEPRRRLRWAAGVVTGLILAGAALTFSRGGIVGLVFTLLAMVAFRHLRPRHLVLLIVLGALLAMLFPRWIERVRSIETAASVVSANADATAADGATLGRLGAGLAAVRVYAEHPVIGVGPGMFPSYYREQAIEAGFRVAESTRAAHNLYAHVAAETGTLGLLAFLAVPAVTLHHLARARRRWRDAPPELASLPASFGYALVAYLATGVFLHLSYQRYYWLLVALAGATAALATQGDQSGMPRQTTFQHAVARERS